MRREFTWIELPDGHFVEKITLLDPSITSFVPEEMHDAVENEGEGLSDGGIYVPRDGDVEGGKVGEVVGAKVDKQASLAVIFQAASLKFTRLSERYL